MGKYASINQAASASTWMPNQVNVAAERDHRKARQIAKEIAAEFEEALAEFDNAGNEKVFAKTGKRPKLTAWKAVVFDYCSYIPTGTKEEFPRERLFMHMATKMKDALWGKEPTPWGPDGNRPR